MRRILHLSDFHFGSVTKSGIDPQIKALAKMLNKNKIVISHIVFTGDAIDHPQINDEVEEGLGDRETLIGQAFSIAAKNLSHIAQELKVPKDNIVIVCGNHDVDLEKAKSILASDQPCSITNNEQNMSSAFENFEEFCFSVTGRKNHSLTQLYSSDGINFLLLNTNFTNENSYKNARCINCKNVSETIKNWSNLPNNVINIAVSHAPSDDICENAKHGYQNENHNYSVIETDILKYFPLWLCGDKHAGTITKAHTFAGAPLSPVKRISYNIISLEDNGKNTCKKLVWETKQKKWEWDFSHEELSSISSYSFIFLKPRTLKALNCRDDNNTFTKNLHSFQWSKINTLFGLITDLKKTEPGRSGISISKNKNLLDQIKKIIEGSEQKVPISCRGATKLGKSIFLSFLYTYLLQQYVKGAFIYIPVYINFEEIDDVNMLTELNSLISHAKNLKPIFDSPLLYIIDGVNHYRFSKTDVYESLYNLIGSAVEPDDKILYSIDKGQHLKFDESAFGKMREAEFLLYFNPTKLVNKNETYKELVAAYKNLFDSSFEVVSFESLVSSLGISSVDLDLITHINDLGRGSLSDAYREYFDKKTTPSEREEQNIPLAAFLFKYGDLTSFEDIKSVTNADKRICNLIKNQKKLCSYLIAKNYIDHLDLNPKNYTESQADVVNTLYSKEETIFIIDYIRRYNLNEKFIAFFEKIVLSEKYFQAISSAAHILAKIDGKIELIDRVKENLVRNKVCNSKYWLNAERSYFICKISRCDEDHSFKNEYFTLLFHNEEHRKLNRAFHRHYYGDCQKKSHDLNDEVHEGFDFYETWNHLCSHLEKYKDSSERYALLEVELFTLCNLVQSRLMQPKVKTRAGIITGSYFHDESRYPRALEKIKMLAGYIDFYLQNEGSTEVKYVTDYFRRIQSDLESLISQRDVFHPSEIINTTFPFLSLQRTGWKIEHNPSNVTDDDLRTLEKCAGHENIAEHILATYYIGLFYLPTSINNQRQYNKQKVLNTILIHDLGESATGDFPPIHENYFQKKKEEDLAIRNIFMNSTYENVANDLISYYDLWENWSSEKEDINVLIAKDLDKIQMIFKFYEIINNKPDAYTTERKASFMSAEKDIKTQIARRIFRFIVNENPKLKSLVEKTKKEVRHIK